MSRLPLEVAARFAENLIRARQRADLSQEDLGFRSSLHRTEISLLERGTRIPRIDTLIRLAGALSMKPDELLKGLAWEPGWLAAGGFCIASSAESES